MKPNFYKNKCSGRIVLLLSIVLLIGKNDYIAQRAENDLAYVKAARKSWGNLNYESVEQHYKNALDINSRNFEALLELAIFQQEHHENYNSSLNLLLQALEYMPNEEVYELYHYLAISYHYLEKYDDAIDNYEKFKTGITKNPSLLEQINIKIKQCEYAKANNTIHLDGKFINYGALINTAESEFCMIMPLKDSFLIFNQQSEMITKNSIYRFLETIYFSKQKNNKNYQADKASEWPAFENIHKEITGHNAVVSVSITGDTMIVYKQNKLWMSTFKDNNWSVPQKFSKNINIGKHQRHACFSPNGKTLYFSSNKKKGTGGYDLYCSTQDENGNWGAPKNLGQTINTSNDEDSPYITKDGNRLYFASKGHLGFGGYDIYYSDWIDSAWSKPKNAGKTINSPNDDTYFSIANDAKETILLSSSRQGGFGKMDLYYFYKYGQPGFSDCKNLAYFNETIDSTNEGFKTNTINVLITGLDTVLEGKEHEYSSNKSYIYDAKITHTFWKTDTTIHNDEKITVKYDSARVYTLLLEILARDNNNDENRFCVSKNIEVIKEKIAIPYVQPKIFKDTNEMALSIGSKLKEKDMKPLPEGFDVKLKPIYFSFNKHDIRPDQKKIMDENVALIKANPNIVIKIIGHTDKVGSKEHNLKLSQKRAKSTVNYLVNKGVNLNQIVAVLSNGEDAAGVRYKNADGTDDIEKMEVSRRVDFYIIGKTK